MGTLSPEQKLHVAGRVRATDYDTGDIVFANGVTATEEGTGLAFKNDSGKKITILDGQDNLHIEVKVLECGFRSNARSEAYDWIRL